MSDSSRISWAGRTSRDGKNTATPTARNTPFDPSPDRNWQPDNRGVVMNRPVSLISRPPVRGIGACSLVPRTKRAAEASCHVQAHVQRCSPESFSLSLSRLRQIESYFYVTFYVTCGNARQHEDGGARFWNERPGNLLESEKKEWSSWSNAKEQREIEKEEGGEEENRIGSPISYETRSDAFVTRTRERGRKSELYVKMERCWL